MVIILLIIFWFLFVIVFVLPRARYSYIIRLFSSGNVSISGLRGSGKDMLMANVIARRKQKSYISNFDYKIKNKEFIPLVLANLDTKNDYRNFINNKYNSYNYPYPENIDIYISDAGNYFPSQYNGELDKNYKSFTNYMSLSRHLGNNNFHYNAQNLNRVWNKIREQSDIYIRCIYTRVIFKKIVIQKVIVYEKLESAESRVPPFRLRLPLNRNKESKMNYMLYRDKYFINYGRIRKCILIYINKSNYDTRIFKELLSNGG